MADEFEPSLNWPEAGGTGATPEPGQFNAELNYQAGAVPELDLTLSNLADRLGQPQLGPTHWVASKPSARRARLVRRFILIDVILLAAVVVAGLTFRSSPIHPSPTATPTPPQTLLPAGTVTTVVGPTCTTGGTHSEVQLTVVRAISGLYYVAGSGTVAPHSGGTLTNVTVTWAVRYGDGYEATDVSRVNGGHAVGVDQTAAWSARSVHSEGSVPPISVHVVDVAGPGSLGNCH